jgi:non-heme chloroperoxidase
MTLIVIGGLVLLAVAVLAGMIVFGRGDAPPPLASVSEPFSRVDFRDLPPPQTTPSRDGSLITFRVWSAASPDEPERVVIAIHGSSAHSSSMHPLGKMLRADGIIVYAPDVRGHGGTGQRGDIDHAGQLDDDAADFVAMVRAKHPQAHLVLLGFSSGGGFALHLVGSPLGRMFERAVLISPMLGPRAPTARGIANAWATPFLPRIIALAILNKLGIHALESVRRLQAGLQSFLSMRRIDARRKNASAFLLRFSQSLASRRQRLSQAMERSTIQRLGRTTNPLTRSERLTISTSRCGRTFASAFANCGP